MDISFLARWDLVPTYIYIVLTSVVNPSSVGRMFVLWGVSLFVSPLDGKENLTVFSCLVGHHVSSMAFDMLPRYERIGRSIRAWRSSCIIGFLCALHFVVVLHIGHWDDMSISLVFCFVLVHEASYTYLLT